jgi:hypothetical protein
MYFTILAKVDEVNDSSYERTVNQGKKDEHQETVQQFEIALSVPGMRDRVRVTFTPENLSVTQDKLDQWELEETWVMVKADSMRANAFDGSRGATALVSFNGVEVREATNDERKQLQQARKASKLKGKERRASAKAERAAAKKAQQPAA